MWRFVVGLQEAGGFEPLRKLKKNAIAEQRPLYKKTGIIFIISFLVGIVRIVMLVFRGVYLSELKNMLDSVWV